MPAQFSAYPPDRAAVVRVLDDDAVYDVGRSPECELCLDHVSVSRFHAQIERQDGEWTLTDTGSKNGLRVDGHLVARATLARPTWFAVGDVYCWLEPLTAEAAAAVAAYGEVRRSISRALSQRLQRVNGVEPLLQHTLDAVLELSGMQRGFALYGEPGDVLRIRARRGIEAADIKRHSFSGSAGAVERCVATRESVICCDTSDSPWLGARPSVQLGGIRALVCVPIPLEDGAVGAIYADSHRPGPILTELDLEIIENVGQHAAAAIAAVRLRGEVDALLDAASEAGVESPRWDEIRPPA
jgi:GAF domain-containing protein